MIRFIDCSKAFWGDKAHKRAPCCAFFSTVTSAFFLNPKSDPQCHIFESLEEIEGFGDSESFLALVPEGFFGE